MDLVNPYDVDELSGMDTDSNEYLEPQAYALDNLDRYNRLYIDRVRVVKESQGRRANARVPQVSNVAVTTITRLKTVRTPGGSQETHFSTAYQTSDELGWLARENEANELNGKWYDAHDVEPRAEHGIHRGSQLPGWEIDPGARYTMVEFPDPDVRPLCHDGCTREPSEQSKAVQPELGRSQLCRVSSLPEIDVVIPTPTRDRILRDYSFVRKEVRQQNEVKTQINGAYFWPLGYPVGGASPTAQDQTGINKLMNDVKQRGCQSIINKTGISELFNEARPLNGLTRVYFLHATLHFDLRFLTALERLTSNAHQCFTSYEHVMTASDSAASSRPLTGIEQHRGPHHRCQIAGDGQAQRWIPLDLESEQITLVKSEILAGAVTIQFTTQPSDPQEIFIVPATAPFIVVIDGSPLVALGRRCSGCSALSLGDVSHGRSEEFYCACNHLNANSDRVQMLNERHPLICAAVLELDRRAKELIPMIESLPFTAMTPSKDLGRITAHRNTLSIYRVAECDGCGHVMAAVNGGKCTNCNAEWSGDSASVIQATQTARGNLNERLLRTLEKAIVTQSPAWVYSKICSSQNRNCR